MVGGIVISQLTWLDFSESQQRGIRDALRAFEDKGTVDDLGFGVIRDGISNSLFPGTSIIQTRARYFLFIPWIFTRAQDRWPHLIVEKASIMEKSLIQAIKTGGDTDGLIGKTAGNKVKTLPSAIYWAGLQTFGIFKLRGKTIRQYGRIASRRVGQSEFEGEVADMDTPFWASFPDPPADFYDFQSATFSLTRDEAGWLADRMLSTSRGFEQPNLLSQLVLKVQAGETALLDPESVWSLSSHRSLTEQSREMLFHAERFSMLANGLALLYNEMLCERRRVEQSDFAEDADYIGEMELWAEEASEIDLLDWCRSLDSFWSCLAMHSAMVPHRTRRFVEDAAGECLRVGVSSLSGSHALREIIIKREVDHKGRQARFVNPSRLNAYQGQAGTDRMVFRWKLVQRLLNDISDGLAL